MDIIVRVPKDQIEHFWEEPPEDATAEYWRIPSRPSKVNPTNDDRIWFVIDGQIVAAASIFNIEPEPDTYAYRVYWSTREFKKLDAPVKAEKVPFRGYLYLPVPPDAVTYWCGWEVPHDVPGYHMSHKWPLGMKGWHTGGTLNEPGGWETWTGSVQAPTPARAEAIIRGMYGKSGHLIRMRWEPKPKEPGWRPPSDRFPDE